MHVETTERGWIVRLDRGEEIVAALLAFAREHDVPSAEVRGIGAIRDVELGWFDPDEVGYHRTTLSGSVELVSLIGNLAWDGDEPFLHAHAVVAGPDLIARGGHVFRGTVSATVEVFIAPTTTRVRRRLDETVGLKLMTFGD